MASSLSPNSTNITSAGNIAISSPVPLILTQSDARFDVDTIVLYLHYQPDQKISEFAMGESLVEAMAFLRCQLNRTYDVRLPSDDWTFIKEGWNCILYVEKNPHPGPSGLSQHLTYRTLLSTVVGLWDSMYVKDLFFRAEFEIYDKNWGWVGTGSMMPWASSSEITTS